MKTEHLDLSKHADAISAQYTRLSKTHIRLLASQVPETFLHRFQDEQLALQDFLDVIYGTIDED
jgi:hypothetical protein